MITDSKGYTTKYAHMDSLNVSAGQSVKKGDNIGKSGNTGSSTGSHLHIECLYNGEYYNPLFYFEAGEQTIYGETTGGTGGGTSNVIPPESYDDVTVRVIAEKDFDSISQGGQRDDEWKAFRIQGTLDFSLIGILLKISCLMAENNIGIETGN